MAPTFKSSFVINLPNRPNRLQYFLQNSSLPMDTLEVFEAIDGNNIDLSSYIASVHPWLLEYSNEKNLRGILGCKLSHEALWRKISQLDDGFYCIFEDDAIPTVSNSSGYFESLIELEPEADLIWLNYPGLQYNFFKLIPFIKRIDRMFTQLDCKIPAQEIYEKMVLRLSGAKAVPWASYSAPTTEAYLIRPRFAAKLVSYTQVWVDAIDTQMKTAIDNIGGRVLFSFPPLYRQAEMFISDIQSH